MNDRKLTVPQLIQSIAGKRPDSVCLIDQCGSSVSYGELWREIKKHTEALFRLGIERQDRVALLLPPGENNIVTLLSTMSCSICVPLSPEMPVCDLRGRLSRIKASALMLPDTGYTDAARLAAALGVAVFRVCGTGENPFSIELRSNSGGEADSVADNHHEAFHSAAGDSSAVMLFTSGTSAAPKLVALKHRQLLGSASDIASALQLLSDDRQLNVLPLHHIHGLSTALSSLQSGGSIVCTKGYLENHFPDCLYELGITWYSASPSIHRQIISRQSRASVKASAHSRLRFVRSASEKMPPGLREEIESRLGVPVIEAYGMTEASPQISSNRPSQHERKMGSVGKAAGPEIRIIDTYGKTLPCGTIGEISIKGDNVITSYEDSDIETRHAFIDGWLRTGDEGYLDDDGFLFVTGRLNDIINRGGTKISPGRIEKVLNNHPDIAESIVFGVPDNRLGQEVSAAIVLAQGVTPGYCDTSQYLAYKRTIEKLQSDFISQLSRPELPKSFYIVEHTPSSGSGGKRKRAVPEQFQAMIIPDPDQQQQAADRNLTLSRTESFLVRIWSEVLDNDQIEVSDHFAHIGGDSLAAARVISQINEVFRIRLPVSYLFDYPSVSSLSTAIGAHLSDRIIGGQKEIFQTPQHFSDNQYDENGDAKPRNGYQLSDVQKQIWFMHQNDLGVAYHMSASLLLFGNLCAETLETALNEIARRHDSLRIGIRYENGAPRQFVRTAVENQLEFVDLKEHPRHQRKTILQRLAFEAHNRPFDLSQDCLSRLKLVRVDDDEHLLLITIHHIISDGWSINILYRELSSIYSSILLGDGYENRKPALQFTAYAESLKSDAFSNQEPDRYWEEKLSDCPTESRFPPDHLMPSKPHYNGGTVRSRIGKPLYRKMQAAARRHNVTLYVFLLAAFKTLLYRYSGQADSVIGTAVAGRNLQSTQDVFGCFANTVVLRSNLTEDTLFEDFLQSTSAEIRNTLDHADVSLMELTHKTDVQRRQGRNPIFQTMFVFQDFPDSPLGTGDSKKIGEFLSTSILELDDLMLQDAFEIDDGLHAVPWRHDATSTKFDLALYLRPRQAGLYLGWQFRTGLYDVETIAQIDKHFKRLIELVVDNPLQPIGLYFLPCFAVSGKRQTETDKRRLTLNRETNFIDQFRQQVSLNPDAIAVTTDSLQWTYTELDQISSQVARHLKKRGVLPANVVAIVLGRRIELLALILGVWKAGATYLPCDPDYPAERISYVMGNSSADFVISDQTTKELVDQHSREGPSRIDLDTEWLRMLEEESHSLNNRCTPEAPAYTIYTSGSSGHPDKVVVNQGNLAYYCNAMKEALQLATDDRYLHSASISFSSSIRQLVVPLVSGCSIYLAKIAEVRDPEKLCRLVCSQTVTVMDLVPWHWSLIVGFLESRKPEYLTQWRNAPPRLMLSASESLSSTLYTRMKAYSGRDTRIINMYGQTETTGIVSMHQVSDHDQTRAVIPVGKPIPGTDISILDKHHHPVPIGIIGELHVASRAITRQHVQLDGKQYYKTGDLARQLRNGSIEFTGRIDQRVKIRGYRIDPAEIENRIRQCPDVEDVVVEAISTSSDWPYGKAIPSKETSNTEAQLAAFIVFTEDSPRAESNRHGKVRSQIRKWLPPYMVPTHFVELSRFPLLPNRKIDRPSLRSIAEKQTLDGRKSLQNHSSGDQQFTPTEQSMAAIWRQLLKIDVLDRDDNFFDLGGDSLLSVELVEQCGRADMRISLEDVFQHQTLCSLSSCTDQEKNPANRQASHGEPPAARKPLTVGVSVSSLRAFSIEALATAGLKTEIAEIVTAVQLEASLRGQLTHNISSIPRYARRIQSGKINAAPELRIIRESPNSALMSGDNGPGQWVAVEAMKLAVKKAKEQGIGLVSVRQSNHFGAAGHYPWLATQAGLIGLCTTNGPVILAPTGGLTATLGNNPLAVGIPSSQRFPILMDITMSVAPRGKIGVTLTEGHALPEGWIYDSHGQPSTNLADLAAGLGVPIGDHKGYGLALIMEILSGVLSGSGFGLDHRREQIRQNSEAPDIGHFLLVIDPELFMTSAQFRARTDNLIEQLKSAQRMDGVDEILLPGEKELRTREVSLTQGVRLQEFEYNKLIRLGHEMKLVNELERN